MKKVFLFICFLLPVQLLHSQVNIYAALNIPDSLKKEADVVVREQAIKFMIKDINNARYDVHQVITVLNEQGKAYLSFDEFSSQFRFLDDAEIKIYDAFGNKKYNISKKEMTSLYYGEGLVPEGKLTYFNVAASSYPITIEINYSIKYRGLLSYPGNCFQYSNQSVQNASFVVEVPSELSLRYKLLNTNCRPVISKNGNKYLYHWEVKNIAAFKTEKHVGSSENYLPQVMLAPNKFKLDDYEGDMTSWKNYGIWINDLYANVSGLPEEKKQFYRGLVKNAATDKEKAAILYNYLQNNMRYVSIQLGIGGWRPFTASFVDDKKYGDCKALSNYLKSTLDAVGISSNLVIIYRDYKAKIVDEKFPMNDFNHVILCIPHEADSIWLECTSTTLPFASLDETTLNRKAVMITGDGGILVNTPNSNFKNNTKAAHTLIEVDEDGGGKVKTNYTLSGEDRDRLLMRYHDLKEDEKRKYFITQNEWKQPDNLQISNSKDKANPYHVSASMDYEKIYSFNAGSKLFFEIRLYPLFDEDIPDYENRKADFYFTFPYQVIDTTVYKFPPGYTLENLPKSKLVSFSFATYSCNYAWDAANHTLSSYAVLQIKDRVIKAADYTKLVDFKKQVMADVNEKIVIKQG